jgi:hypothetical protein
MVECPSKPIETFYTTTENNYGAVCMPYFGFRGNKGIPKYNGPKPNGHGYE